jgi:hypothetical protein
MRRTLESRYALAESVELCLEEHESDFAADEELRGARAKLREQLRAVCKLARDPLAPRKGFTAERRKVRDLLVHALVEVHGIMHAWAAANGNERLQEMTRNAAYRVHRLPDLELRDLAGETRTNLERHRRGLEKFGVEDTLRRAFARLQKEFERTIQTAALEAAVAEEAGSLAMVHDEVLEDLVKHIRDVVDPLVWRYQHQAPRFVRAYQSARRVAGMPKTAESVQLLS